MEFWQMDLIVAFGHAQCFEGELYTTVSGVFFVFLCGVYDCFRCQRAGCK